MLLAAVMTSLSCLAYNITGKVSDPDGEMLPQASVRLLKAGKDSTFVGGVTTGLDGHFKLANLRNGRYIVEITYLGYAPARRDVAIKGQSVDLDTIVMSADGIALKEVKI